MPFLNHRRFLLLADHKPSITEPADIDGKTWTFDVGRCSDFGERPRILDGSGRFYLVMYSTILTPTDGSDSADEAMEVSLTLANQFDSTVHTLFVIDERFVATDYDMVVEEAERKAEQALDRAGQRGTEAEIEVEKHLRMGVPHKEILRAIDAYDADLVVMGKHGRTGLDQFLHLGSVTDRVLRSTSIHVLTVPI